MTIHFVIIIVSTAAAADDDDELKQLLLLLLLRGFCRLAANAAVAALLVSVVKWLNGMALFLPQVHSV